MGRKYIKNKIKGISLGLEFPYRLAERKTKFLLYRMSDGKIIKKFPNKEYSDRGKAIERLYEINKLEKSLSEEVKMEIDATE